MEKYGSALLMENWDGCKKIRSPFKILKKVYQRKPSKRSYRIPLELFG